MKKLILLMTSMLIIIVGCSSHNTLNINYLDPSEANGPIRKWIESNNARNGIYLGRVSTEHRVYLYVNYKNEEHNQKFTVPSVDIQNQDGKLIVETVTVASDHSFEKIFVITKKGIKQIELNGQEFNLEQLEELE
ncbi:hypothetical protein [Paenibacillus agri]|uniref:Lipoprotein n=1 Tax=Paenibacillus agri TaxID=2744309 RepID=A0A850EMZ1_9BACL|nr:hypothetical protein [Paenibacillus agri]NUU61786.1 hypothetical protein [Paenibacillus agri]